MGDSRINPDACQNAKEWVQYRLTTGEPGYAEFELHPDFTLVLDWDDMEARSTSIVPSGSMAERIMERRDGEAGDGGLHYYPVLLVDVNDDLAAELDCIFGYEAVFDWCSRNQCFIH